MHFADGNGDGNTREVDDTVSGKAREAITVRASCKLNYLTGERKEGLGMLVLVPVDDCWGGGSGFWIVSGSIESNHSSLG